MTRSFLLHAAALLVLILAFAEHVTARSDHRIRDINPLSSSSLHGIAKADPQPWTSVDSGHLGRLLIPRPAGSKNKFVEGPDAREARADGVGLTAAQRSDSISSKCSPSSSGISRR
jgi:hypothetical protein